MEIERCDRDKMVDMLKNNVFSISAAKSIGQSDGCIHGFIGEQIQSILRRKDSQGNKIPQKVDDLYEMLSGCIKDMDRATFDVIVEKLKPQFITEQNGVLYWRMDRVPNMPL